MSEREEAHAKLDEAFKKLHLRMVDLRITPMELLRDGDPVTYQTYWRCRSSSNRHCSGHFARAKVLGQLEQAITKIEESRKEDA
jgi:hypothetical protein